MAEAESLSATTCSTPGGAGMDPLLTRVTSATADKDSIRWRPKYRLPPMTQTVLMGTEPARLWS
ncbi:hypothetical protein GCM10018965_042500 [Nonomuraea roseola]